MKLLEVLAVALFLSCDWLGSWGKVIDLSWQWRKALFGVSFRGRKLYAVGQSVLLAGGDSQQEHQKQCFYHFNILPSFSTQIYWIYIWLDFAINHSNLALAELFLPIVDIHQLFQRLLQNFYLFYQQSSFFPHFIWLWGKKMFELWIKIHRKHQKINKSIIKFIFKLLRTTFLPWTKTEFSKGKSMISLKGGRV